MKRRKDQRGRLVRVFEPGDGMRRRFYDALEESRFQYPRRAAFRHPLWWYCDGHVRRPVNGVWTCATLAEHLLALSKSHGNPDILDAARFFAATRRAMKFIVSHYRIASRLPPDGVAFASRSYAKLCAEGTSVLRKMGYLTPTTEV